MTTLLRFAFVILFLGFQSTYSQNTLDLQKNNHFKLYPNPLGASRTLMVSGHELIHNIKIYSILGKELLNKNFENIKAAELNLKALNTGVYLVQINNERTSRLMLE
ncbi:T9SS type A sorting domain-containing protein [Flavisericum labens]|uniref:T9SS type A sorting domain-containing protein n=1 Tax=Flavisericum labens TaxID=3377112 RepID=UPI00387AD09D